MVIRLREILAASNAQLSALAGEIKTQRHKTPENIPLPPATNGQENPSPYVQALRAFYTQKVAEDPEFFNKVIANFPNEIKARVHQVKDYQSLIIPNTFSRTRFD